MGGPPDQIKRWTLYVSLIGVRCTEDKMHDLVCGLPCLDRGCIGRNNMQGKGRVLSYCYVGLAIYFLLFFHFEVTSLVLIYLFVQAAFCFRFLVLCLSCSNES